MGTCRGMCQYASIGTPCDCKCGGSLHGIRAGLHAPTTTAGKLHIDLEHAGQQVMIFDDTTEIQTAEAHAQAPEADADMTVGAVVLSLGTTAPTAPAGDDHGETDLPLHDVRTDDAGAGVDSVGHSTNDALPGMPDGGDDHHELRRAVLLDDFRVVPVTREWREGGAWREWCGWRIDDKRGPFYGDTPQDAVVAARRGSLRIVRTA
jgi:hypothetical protein